MYAFYTYCCMYCCILYFLLNTSMFKLKSSSTCISLDLFKHAEETKRRIVSSNV